MEISGASKALEKAMIHIEPELEHLETNMLPLIMKLEEMERNWNTAKKTFTYTQKEHVKKRGYTFLTQNQSALIYSRNGDVL